MLTPKQAAFVREYVVDLNATQAAIRAGYSPKTANEQASRLLANVSVATAVAEQRQIAAQRNDLTIDWVLDGLKQNLRRAMQAEPVFDAEGRATGEYVYQGAVANKALELLGRHIGMWAVKPVEVTGQIDVHVHEQLTALRGLSVETLRGFVAPKLLAPPMEGEE